MIWKRLYNKGSSLDKGTMHQIRNLINRTSVPLDPQNNMNAAEDFMLLLLHSHIVAAAETIQLVNSTDNVVDLAKAIVTQNVRLPRWNNHEPKKNEDQVYMYATELLSLALIWHGFHDSIREGDGDRILRYWKLLLVLFKSSNNHNYAKEAVNILLQYYYILSDRQKAQLLWSRCINTRGVSGANIACDLHMEHLNRRLKTVIRSMGANVNPTALEKAGKAIAPVHHVCQVFEQQTALHMHSDRHSAPSFGEDFNTVVSTLRSENVFTPTQGRAHTSYKFNSTLLEKHSLEDMKKKVEGTISKLYFL